MTLNLAGSDGHMLLLPPPRQREENNRQEHRRPDFVWFCGLFKWEAAGRYGEDVLQGHDACTQGSGGM